MPAACMPAAREAFRRVHDGNPPRAALVAFAIQSGLDDKALMARLEAALKDLAADKSQKE